MQINRSATNGWFLGHQSEIDVPHGQLRSPPCASRFHKSWLPPRVARHVDVQAATPKQTNIYRELQGIAIQSAWAVSFSSREGPWDPAYFMTRLSVVLLKKRRPSGSTNVHRNLCFSFVPPRQWEHCLHPNEQLTLVQLVGQRNLAEEAWASGMLQYGGTRVPKQSKTRFTYVYLHSQPTSCSDFTSIMQAGGHSVLQTLMQYVTTCNCCRHVFQTAAALIPYT